MADDVQPAAPAPSGKAPWQSKTLWSNLIMAVIALLPIEGLQDYLLQHSGILPMAFLLANVVLRIVTKDKIQLE